jgi:hypothetical protein
MPLLPEAKFFAQPVGSGAADTRTSAYTSDGGGSDTYLSEDDEDASRRRAAANNSSLRKHSNAATTRSASSTVESDADAYSTTTTARYPAGLPPLRKKAGDSAASGTIAVLDRASSQSASRTKDDPPTDEMKHEESEPIKADEHPPRSFEWHHV